ALELGTHLFEDLPQVVPALELAESLLVLVVVHASSGLRPRLVLLTGGLVSRGVGPLPETLEHGAGDRFGYLSDGVLILPVRPDRLGGVAGERRDPRDVGRFGALLPEIQSYRARIPRRRTKLSVDEVGRWRSDLAQTFTIPVELLA